MLPEPKLLLRRLRRFPNRLVPVLAAVAKVAFGDAQAAAGSPAPVRLELHPPSIQLHGPADEHGLVVTARYADGRELDVTSQATFQVSATNVTGLRSGGRLVAKGDGSAIVVAHFGGTNAAVSVRVSGSNQPGVPSFRQDIEPILTRTGCNAGGCHGKLAGQNGFKLSLRGYAPELDFDSLVHDLGSRRIDPAQPDDSLLLLKGLGDVPHEGGQRFEPGSRYHTTLRAWIAARGPGPATEADESDAITLGVFPGDRTLAPGDSQQLLIQATYPDGRRRDVTWLARFFSNDEGVARVSHSGLVSARRPGETSIRAHFQGQVAVVRVTIPSTNTVEEFRFGRAQNAIDEAVFARLRALKIPPSPRCLDEVFLRRVALDLTGMLPTPDEVREFLEDRRPDKRERWIDELMQRPQFVDFWTLQLADLLQNRKERDHDVRGTKGVRGFHSWLRTQVAMNRPWDELVRDLLLAAGSSAEHPEIGYFITTVGEKPAVESEVVDSVAQAFLGTRIGCARCHNHPLERYTQDDFYHFAAFFSRLTLERRDLGKEPTELLVMSRDERDRRREMEESAKKLKETEAQLVSAGPADIDRLKSEFTNRQRELGERKRRVEEARGRPAMTFQPRTKRDLPARPLDRSSLAVEAAADPRRALAGWLTSPTNETFSGAIINRLWKHFLGTGLVEPVDDLRASNPPSNPAVWALLQRELVEHRFDLRHVMRLIVTSRTYQLSSQTVAGNATDTRFHSHYYARRLPAEVLLDAIASATGVPDTFQGQPVGVRAVQLPDPGVSSYFLSLFGRSERVTACACERNGDVTLPQLLHLQNGEETARKIRDPAGRLKQRLAWGSNREQLVEELYLATVGRRPRPTEQLEVLRALGDGNLEEAATDLLWALLNSKEFTFNH